MSLPPLSEPKSSSTRIIGFLHGTIAFGVLLPGLVFINVLQTLSLLIKPFSSHAFRRFNRACAQFWWAACHHWAERVHGIDVKICGDELPPEENVVLVCNHQEMPDIPSLFKLAYEKRRLGDLKWYVKDILKYVPGIGWGMLFLDCLFVKRNWTSDKEYITGVFDKILRHKIPLWVISFVEGTRIRPSKLASSNAYAEKNDLQTTEHVLLPRTKGFAATVEALRPHLDAVYDVTIGYVDGVPTIWQWFKGYPKVVHVHVQRFPTQGLPEDREELGDWLTEQWYQKDALLDYYYANGVFPETVPSEPLEAEEPA